MLADCTHRMSTSHLVILQISAAKNRKLGMTSNPVLNFLNIISLSTFYEKEAMLMDPVDGPILASLLGIYKLC